MSCIYAEQHDTEESIKWLKVAIGKGFDDWLLIESPVWEAGDYTTSQNPA
jgi:hypothetical protein